MLVKLSMSLRKLSMMPETRPLPSDPVFWRPWTVLPAQALSSAALEHSVPALAAKLAFLLLSRLNPNASGKNLLPYATILDYVS